MKRCQQRARDQRGYRRRVQGGFTLIELMVGLVVSSLLIAMVLSIVLRMSTSYRGQQQITEMQQILASATTLIRQDTKAAGYAVPNGFRLPSGAGAIYTAPIQFINGGGGVPDELRLYWADASVQARVMPVTAGVPGIVPAGAITSIEVDDTTGFNLGDVIAIANLNTEQPSEPAVVDEAFVAAFRTCVAQVRSVGATTLQLVVSGTYGTGTNNHCDDVRDNHVAEGASPNTMVYRFVGRAYRIDGTRPDLGVLQMSPSGALVLNDWQDIGIGFTDLQVAARYYDGWTAEATVDTDGDGDFTREWYSTFATIPSQALWPVGPVLATRFGPFPQPIEANITFVARTLRKVEGVGTRTLPAFDGQLGDQTAGNATEVNVDGNATHVYRYITAHIDFRNMAVSR